MKNEVLYTVEAKILFKDVGVINDELPKIKNELNKVFENIIVHYDLSDEVDEFNRECVGIRIEISKYGAKKDLTIIKTMSKDIVHIIKQYNIRDYSIKSYKD